jgi:hypothetical protein
MKEQGVENPEDYVLTAYRLSDDINKIPVPLDTEDGFEQGLLMLYPEEAPADGETPAAGGVFGTVKSIFRAMGFTKTKEEVIAEEPISRSIAKVKRGKGLYGDAE